MYKLSFILNYASHYRTAVYRLIDKSFNCKFYFGDSLRDNIKKMSYDNFRGRVEELSVRWLRGKWCYYKNVLSVLKDGSDIYILTGDMRNLSNWFLLLLIKLFYPHKKSAVWTHGWYGKESEFEIIVKKAFYSLVDVIFCYGDRAKSLMIARDISAEKVYAIHNSLDYEQQRKLRILAENKEFYSTHFGNNNHNLIFVGRLTKVKRLDMILDAMAQLRSQGENYNLTIVGDGGEEKQLKKLVQELDISNHVWFYGACYTEEELAKLLYNADLCVSPGNVGLTGIHAMSYGTPVVTHNKFELQMPEFEAIKDGKTGSFFDYEDVDSLAKVISAWFSIQRDNRDDIREESYREIETNWTPKYQVEVLKTAIERL